MFTGRRFDPKTGLYYYRMRYYSPDLGRFLQPDPIGYADGMNIYAYCGNNPLTFVDPMGLKKGTARKPDADGMSLSASWVNPFTSRTGGVKGRNRMNFSGSRGKPDFYDYDGGGFGLDVGIAFEYVAAWGEGSWDGTFKSINISYGPFTGSYYWSLDNFGGNGQGWHGFTAGVTVGLPKGIAIEKTNYVKDNGPAYE